MKLSEIKDLGINCEVARDAEFDSLGMATSHYTSEKVLCFLVEDKYLEEIIENKSITALMCRPGMIEQADLPSELGVLLCDDPRMAFFNVHNLLVENGFYWKPFENRISNLATISKQAMIADESVEIGDGCIIEHNVVIHPGSIIGKNVTIRSGSHIGTNGFQFISLGDSVFPVTTGGRTIIKDNVEIQHICCVDRGVLGGDTVLEPHVKLDNFVHVAHDTIIGARSIVTAGVKIAGRVTIGRDCWLGVNATISNGINIGDNCRISLGSVVTQDVKPGSTVSGNFAVDHKKFIEFIKSIR